MLAKLNEVQESIFNLEHILNDVVAKGEFPVAECPLKHHLHDGVYAREIFIPAGSVVVGKIHKKSHLNLISRGRVYVVTEFGNQIFDATERPVTFASEAGTKRALLAETDVIWTTFHKTDKTELADIEDDIIAKDYSEVLALTYCDIKGAIQ
jgi:hypothetical protein